MIEKVALADKAYEEVMLDKILQHLKTCRPKEVAQHAERASICINKDNRHGFIEVLNKRRPYLSDSQRKRVDSLIKHI